MTSIIDPFTQVVYCGVCGEPAVDLDHAGECCATAEPAPLRAIIAGALVLLAVVFLLTLPLWT